MQPPKIRQADLARLWGVSPQRVSQLIVQGRVKKDADGLVNTAEALAFRTAQISEEEARVLFQSYSNGSTVTDPKIGQHMAAEGLSDDDILFGVAEPASPGAAHDVFNASTELSKARLALTIANIEARKLRTQKDAGALIQRTEVAASGFEAGRIVSMILQNLPAEIASIFADANQKEEVRAKVQQRVDQMQHALHAGVSKLGVSE